MANIQFITGVMGAGKTAKLIEDYYTRYNGDAIVVKAGAERTKSPRVTSRNGRSLEKVLPIYLHNVLRNQYEDLEDIFENTPISKPILIDEAQFLSTTLIDLIFRLAIDTGREVRLYGLHSDFRGEPFNATRAISKYLPRGKWKFIDMKCQEENCDLIAAYNARFLESGEIDVNGPVILQEKSVYRSICRPHFIGYVNKK